MKRSKESIVVGSNEMVGVDTGGGTVNKAVVDTVVAGGRLVIKLDELETGLALLTGGVDMEILLHGPRDFNSSFNLSA